MNAIRAALTRNGVVDITTTGRKTGWPRRIEVMYHAVDGRIFISGQPALKRRSWLANLEANPQMTFHLKRGVMADLPATARIVTDPNERRQILTHVARNWNRKDLDTMMVYSPLIEVILDDPDFQR
jgi:deazaflavin-dependent oxidoreductase (nitroreductase family)